MSEIPTHALGPKDWDPHTDRCLCPKNDLPLLTPEEKQDLRELERFGADFGDKFAAMTRRICATMRRLAWLTPLDFEFPRYAGLANPVADNVMYVRFVERLLIEKYFTVPEGAALELTAVDHMISCRVTEAVAFVRPYVRAVGTPTAAALEALRSAKFRIVVDGDCIVRDGPLESLLLDAEGRGRMRRPFTFLVPNSSHALRASCVGPDGGPLGGFEPEKRKPAREFGLFLTNGDLVSLFIIGGIPPVGLKTGLVAALYTVKP